MGFRNEDRVTLIRDGGKLIDYSPGINLHMANPGWLMLIPKQSHVQTALSAIGYMPIYEPVHCKTKPYTTI